MSNGTIVQCIGAVVDIEFPREQMPHVYNALMLDEDKTNKLVEQGLTFEVQQQLGDGIVRTIAMGSSDGLRRGMKVQRHREQHHGAGRPRRARPRDGRVGSPDRRAWPDQSRTSGAEFISRRRSSTSCRRRSSCWKPASR